MAGTKANYWKLGLFVMSCLFVAVVGVIWLGATSFEKKAIEAITYLDESVQGLDAGSPVKYRGVTIGSVASIRVAPDRRHVELRIEISEDRLIALGMDVEELERQQKESKAIASPDMRFQLASAGITGVKFLQLRPVDVEKNPAPELPFEPPWNYVPSMPSTLLTLEEGAEQLIRSVTGISQEASALIVDIRAELEGGLDLKGVTDRLKNVLDKVDEKLTQFKPEEMEVRAIQVMEGADETLKELRSFVAKLQDDDGTLMKLLVRMESTSAVIEEAVRDARVGDTTASLRETSDSLRGDVTDATKHWERLSQELIVLAKNLDSNLFVLRETLLSIRSLAKTIERQPSALLFGKQAAPSPQVNR